MENPPSGNTSSSSSSTSLVDANQPSKWLDAHYDPVAGLYTFTQCMTLADIYSDGDFKLVIADLGNGQTNMKLKVFKGATMIQQNTIMDLPTGVSAFYMDTNDPKTPAVAVASGPYIYVYKNLRPYYKFTLPSLPVNPLEEDLWNQVREDQIDVNILREMLDNIRQEGSQGSLTARSLKFLQLHPEDLESFANLYKHAPLKKQTVITCLQTLKKSMADEDAVSCLVLGTESRSVYVLDPEAFTVLANMALPAVPAMLHVSGLFDVEFRVIVACRDGGVYVLRRGNNAAKILFSLNAQAVGLEKVNKTIVVACVDQTLQGFSTKGRPLWSVNLPAKVLSVAPMDYSQRGYQAVLVGLANSEVHIYNEKFLVHVIKTEDIVTGIKFGQFGRESSALIMTTRGGGLLIKILRRNATFEGKEAAIGPPAAQNTRLNVPKKTKLFVEQTMRERQNCISMHRRFQQDLYLLRLKTAREYVKTLDTASTPFSTSTADPLKLSAQIQGIGPTFKLTVSIQNTSLTVPSMGLAVSFDYDDALYQLQDTYLTLPMLVPGLDYAFETFVESVSDKGIADVIKVFVLKQDNPAPLITAMINMPVSETVVVV